MATIFTRIINGEIPSYKVAENEYCYAFLDINPLVLGHTLLVPKFEEDYIFNLPSKNYEQLWLFAHKLAKAIENSVECKRVGLAVLGMEVPHAHIHLVPLNTEDDLNFKKAKLQLSKEEFESIAARISQSFKYL